MLFSFLSEEFEVHQGTSMFDTPEFCFFIDKLQKKGFMG